MAQKRLFRSSKDFTSEIVQLEILEMENSDVYIREFKRINVNGKFKMAKKGWVKLNKTISEMAAAHRASGLVYKIQYNKRFLYSAPITKFIGPK